MNDSNYETPEEIARRLTEDPYIIDRKIAEARRLRAEELARTFRSLFAVFRSTGRKAKADDKGLRRA